MAELKDEIVEVNASPARKEIKGCANICFTPSRFFGERASESMDSDREHGSTLVFEADMQSSMAKSEISIETRLIAGNGSLEMEMMHDSQHMTESSCSYSLPVVVPISISDKSYQECSKEGYLFRNCGSSMDSCSSKTLDRSPEEPVTASSESGVSAQVASTVMRNAYARNAVKVLSMDENHSSSMISKGDGEISRSWDHEAATPEDAELLKRTDDAKCFSRNAFSAEERDKDEYWMNESADSSKTKRFKKSVKDQDKFVAGFDLNENINAEEPDDCVGTVSASASSSPGVIHVIAKAGIPCGRPLRPLRFEGVLGWKGTTEASAFRPTAHKRKDPEHFTGIDLNVDVVEDNATANGTSLEHSHSGVDRKQAKSPWIDLNHLYNAADEATHPLVDLNLDTSASLRSNNAHWLGRGCQFFGNRTSDLSSSGMKDFSLTRNVYLADLSTMHHPANNARTVMAIFPEPLNPYNNTLHLARFLHQKSSSNASAFVQVKTADLLSTSASKIDAGPRQFQFFSKDSSMRETMHQEARYAPSLERKVPEG